MADINIDNLTVLLLRDNIVIATSDKAKILYSLKHTLLEGLQHHFTDTIQDLRTGQVHRSTTTEERELFLKWFHPNINNIKAIYKPLQILN